jgi:hypothetical protein
LAIFLSNLRGDGELGSRRAVAVPGMTGIHDFLMQITVLP